MASGVAESPLETVARVGFVTAGLAVSEQVVVRGVGRVDFVVEEAVAVEVDGWEFHQSRDAFERDRARDRALLAGGMPVLRFTARELRATWSERSSRLRRSRIERPAGTLTGASLGRCAATRELPGYEMPTLPVD